MERIDLHTHTLASDGSDTPAAVVQQAAALGLRAVAVTDHDTFAGLPEALAAGQRCGIEVVPGVELSTVWGGEEVHLLGYFMDTGNAALRALIFIYRTIIRSSVQYSIQMHVIPTVQSANPFCAVYPTTGLLYCHRPP